MNNRRGKDNVLSKTGINLAMHEDHSASIRLLVIGCVLILLLAACVAKFGVVDQLARRDAAAAKYYAVHNQLVSMEDALKDYKKVETEYRTHSMDWLGSDTDSAQNRVGRDLILDLVESRIMPRGQIKGIMIYNDLMNINMSGMNLSDIWTMIADLETDPIVSDVRLNLAQTETDVKDDDLLSFSLTVTLQPKEVG